MIGRDSRLDDLLQRVRMRLQRLRAVRTDADFERLVVEVTLTQLHDETPLDTAEQARLRRACDKLLTDHGTLRVVGNA